MKICFFFIAIEVKANRNNNKYIIFALKSVSIRVNFIE
jgi:hypothetical protein